MRDIPSGDLPVPHTPNLPTISRGQPPAIPGRSLHDARHLDYDPDTLRDGCWPKLGTNAQRVLRERVGGEVIDWWAGLSVERLPEAVVLGPAGVCYAEPFVKEDGRLAYRMRLLRFVPNSLTWVTWDNSKVAPAHSGPAPKLKPLLADSLSADFRGFLGNLPGRAQELLQEPFSPRPDLVYRYHYEVQPGQSSATWSFWCYLADDRTVVFECGVKVTNNSPISVRWDVTRYKALRAAQANAQR